MQKISSAKLVLRNSRVSYAPQSIDVLERFAWMIPEGKVSHLQLPFGNVFYADRYGGCGAQFNGGSVRCATDGEWQIKGIGINLLAGYSDDELKDIDGACTLGECLEETIWSEVLQHALPYGSVRIPFIIATGTEGHRKHVLMERSRARGLLVREYAWRPAHFMRASLFRPRPEVKDQISSDTERVKKMIADLPDLLPFPLELSKTAKSKLSELNKLNIGLKEMVTRFAKQMAAAKAKRLMHGTLSSSNICLDGRWIDFGKTSALPGYGPLKWFEPFWTEHRILCRPIKYLSFYIRKYFPIHSDIEKQFLPKSEQLISHYLYVFDAELSKRFISLCGFPEIVTKMVLATDIGQESMRELVTLLYQVALEGHSIRFAYDGYPNEVSKFGRYNVGKTLKALACGYFDEQHDNAINSTIDDPLLRRKLISSYQLVSDLMCKEAKKQGVQKIQFSRLVIMNCTKSGKTTPELYRSNLTKISEKLVKEYFGKNEFRVHAENLLHSIADKARVLYQDPIDFSTLVWCRHSDTIEYDAKKDIWRLNINGQKQILPWNSLIQMQDKTSEIVNEMHNYWGQDLWSFRS